MLHEVDLQEVARPTLMKWITTLCEQSDKAQGKILTIQGAMPELRLVDRQKSRRLTIRRFRPSGEPLTGMGTREREADMA